MTEVHETPAEDNSPPTRGMRRGRAGSTRKAARATLISDADRLRVLTAMVGRLAIPEKSLRTLVTPKGNLNYIRAYNMCDGTNSLSEVADGVGLDPANFRKLVQRWVDAGIIFRVGDKEDVLLHVYTLPLSVEPIAPRDDNDLADVKSR